jgi:hypothetical protein
LRNLGIEEFRDLGIEGLREYSMVEMGSLEWWSNGMVE